MNTILPDWKNLPDKSTALKRSNLLKINEAINELDTEKASYNLESIIYDESEVAKANFKIGSSTLGYTQMTKSTYPSVHIFGGTRTGSSLNDTPTEFLSIGIDNLTYSTGGEFYKVFNEQNCPKSHTSTGYQKLANGTIIQWGFAEIPANVSSITLVFPVAFTFAGRTMVNAVNRHDDFYSTGSSASQVVINKKTINSQTSSFHWISIGY